MVNHGAEMVQHHTNSYCIHKLCHVGQKPKSQQPGSCSCKAQHCSSANLTPFVTHPGSSAASALLRLSRWLLSIPALPALLGTYHTGTDTHGEFWECNTKKASKCLKLLSLHAHGIELWLRNPEMIENSFHAEIPWFLWSWIAGSKIIPNSNTKEWMQAP